jgi:hypothetical protein
MVGVYSSVAELGSAGQMLGKVAWRAGFIEEAYEQVGEVKEPESHFVNAR